MPCRKPTYWHGSGRRYDRIQFAMKLVRLAAQKTSDLSYSVGIQNCPAVASLQLDMSGIGGFIVAGLTESATRGHALSTDKLEYGQQPR